MQTNPARRFGSYVYNGSGNIIQAGPRAYTYDPIGRLSSVTNGALTEQAYTYDRGSPGHERDAATLDYMHARYYDPSMGRFLSVNPARASVVPAASQSWNRYTYVMNRPTTLVDPYGLWWCEPRRCFDGITVIASDPDSEFLSYAYDTLGGGKRGARRRDEKAAASHGSDHAADIPHIWHCIEGFFAPFIAGGGAMVSGGTTMTAGVTATKQVPP